MHNGEALYARNAEKLNGLAPEAYIQPQDNILDNGYFKINQQTKEEYVGSGYTVDRWLINSSSDGYSLKVHDGYIEFINNGKDSAVIRQFLEQLPPGTYTMAVLTGNGLKYGTVVWDGSTGVSAPTSFGSLFIGIMSNRIHMSIFVNPGKNEKFYAAKLEHGPRFTGWPVWNYALELAKCQRYFYRIPEVIEDGFIAAAGIFNAAGTYGYTVLNFPVPMRTVPALRYGGTIEAYIAGRWNTIEAVSLWTESLKDISYAVIRLKLKSTDFAGQSFLIRAEKGAWLEFNANL